MKIQDGKGSGIFATVNPDNHLAVDAVIVSDFEDRSEVDGQAYAFISQVVTLTSAAGETGLLYAKNTSTTLEMHVHSVITSGNAVGKWRFVRNPTTGTLISGGTAATTANLNFNSSNAAAADVFDGDDGETITNGTSFANFNQAAGVEFRLYEGAVILGTSDTIGIAVTPAADGTFSCTLDVWYD